MRLLLAKKRGSAATISQPGGAEVFAITATREVTRPRLPRTKPRFSRFYLVSKHFGRPRSLFLASASLSFVSQLFNRPVFISFSLSLPPAFSFRNDRDREMIYAPLVHLPLCFKFMYSDGENIFTYQGWRRSRSCYEVSTEFNTYISSYILYSIS